MDLLKVVKIKEAEDILFNQCQESGFNVGVEKIIIEDSISRVLAKDIVAKFDVPSFRRSTVDGYAVKTTDLSGASESVPTFLKIVGESKMGRTCDICINGGECVYVPTGGMLPYGSDAIIMEEWVENFTDDKISVYKSIASGENVVDVGEDNKKGDILLKKGRKITSSDIGLLSSNGISEIEVYKTFNVSIISTGDEIVTVNSIKEDGQIYDINSYTLLAECKKSLFNVKNRYLIKDEKDKLKDAIIDSMSKSDVVVISGGSSKGKKDNTAKLIDELCSSGVLVHGIAIKPGKPTIIGYDENTKCVVIGLPGHPVAAVLLFRLLVEKLYEKLTCSTNLLNKIKVKGYMKENVMQNTGRTTFQLVNIDDKYNVIPLYAKSGLINSMSKADGYIIIDENCEGYNVGDEVDVYLLN